MRRLDALRLFLVVLLGLGVVVFAGRVARHYLVGGAGRIEIGRVQLTALEPRTVERLASLESRVFATYYVSSAEHMPSNMRRLERQVTDLLEALRSRAPARFDFQIVDPETRPELAGFAAKRRINPFRVRSVAHDSYSERTIWSSLTLSYGAHPEVRIDGIGPAHLPRLQATIVEHLDRLEQPRRPVIALSAPESGFGFSELRAALAERGRVVDVDLDTRAPFPNEADVLFWIAPRTVTPERLREVDRFLEDGRSVVLAGSEYAIGGANLVDVGGRPALTVGRTRYPAEALYSHFGLRPVHGLLLDRRCDQLSWQGDPLPAPFLIRSIAPQHDFRLWRGQPNGTLLFTTPTAIGFHGPTLAAAGWVAHVLATSSDDSWLQEAPVASESPPLALSAMNEDNGTRVAKQALVIELRHEDPWRGRLVVCAATSPFENGLFHQNATAHRRLVKVTLDELASSERLVAAAARIERPELLPALSPAARLAWRAVCVFLLPLSLALVGLARGVFERKRSAGRSRTPGALGGVSKLAALGALALVVVGLTAALGLRADASEDGLNSLAPESRRIAARAGELGEIRAELLFSRRRLLPVELRPRVRELARALRELDGAGAELDVERIHPEDLDETGRAELARAGIAPFKVTTRDGEVTSVHTITSSLRLTRGERVEVLHFPDARSFESLEFRLAFALWRLETGRKPHVAFASDVPRPSSAEAYEYYQQKGLFSPQGVDVYSIARETVADADFRLTHVNPREPVIPPDTDLLVWLQPRRSIEKMIEATVRYLHGGGRVVLAAQHFNIQSRQYRGADFEIVYWPQPQNPDVEHLYFPELGIELVREVLFDELKTALPMDTQIAGRDTARDFERQESALPFLIRTSAAGHAGDSLVTRHLGDQAFVWANYLRWDDELLRATGVRATPLMTTSERSWSFLWKNRWIPPELLAGPPPDEAGEPEYSGPLPLAVLFEGTFPRPKKPLELMPPPADAEPVPGAPWPAARPGALLMIACSELFKDHRILDPDFRADHLLANAVASLALEPELAEIAARRPVARGFGFVEPEAKIRWRAAVLAGGPLLLLTVGGVAALMRRRRPPLVARVRP